MTSEQAIKRGFRFTRPNHPMHVRGQVYENPTYVVTRTAQGIVYWKMEEFLYHLPVDEDRDRFLDNVRSGRYLPVVEES